MKKLVVILCLCSVLYFQSAVCAINSTNTTESDCVGLSDNITCCNKDGCMYFTCDIEAVNMTAGCHLSSWNGTGVCKNDTLTTNCPKGDLPTTQTATTTTTTQKPDQCTGKPDQGSCCGVDGCIYVACNISNSVTNACYKNDTDLAKACNGTSSNLCSSTPSTTTTTTKPVANFCDSLKDNTTCCASATDKNCTFISCTNNTGQAHTGCHLKGEDLTSICKSDLKDTCAAAPTSPTTPKPNPTTQQPFPNGTTKVPDASANTGNQEHGQHFDGASFIGGIVLCAGIVAIIFFGMKFYKAKAERNYHTL